MICLFPKPKEVAIWVSSPHNAPSGLPRKQAWDELNQHLDLMASKADGIAAEELEALVDDICNEVRHGSR